MKQLVVRLSNEEAAQYKSQLAINQSTMQQHLESCIRAYIASKIATQISATLYGTSEVKAEATVSKVISPTVLATPVVAKYTAADLFASQGLDMHKLEGK